MIILQAKHTFHQRTEDTLHCGLHYTELLLEPYFSSLLRVTVLFIPFGSCGARLLTAGISTRSQGRWRGLLDERQALVGRVARAAETVSHLVRRGEVHFPATNTLLLGVSCKT